MVNIFYSGGYDSTSLMLRCLVTDNLTVQPLVVITPYLDGTSDKFRPSYLHEKTSRDNFYRRFKAKYPNLQHNLLPEITIKHVVLDRDTRKIGIQGFNSGLFTRKTNQLLYFHQICKDRGYDKALVAYQGDDPFSNRLSSTSWSQYLEFPIINQTKNDLLQESIKAGYDEFLYKTWSCWYPIDDKPCGKCRLCEITIVKTGLKIEKTLI